MSFKNDWSEVDPEAEMQFSKPALPDFQIDEEDEQSPTELFLEKMTPPFKLMISNLPMRIPEETLTDHLRNQLNIKSASIQYKLGQTFCYLQFKNRDDCSEAQDIDGKKISGYTLKLKITPGEQSQVVRDFNFSQKNRTENKNRFTQLKRNPVQQQNQRQRRNLPNENKKHNHPVGGSIRKNRNRKMNNNQSNSKKNVWGSSSTGRESQQQPRIHSRRDNNRRDPARFSDNNNNRRNQPRPNQNSRFARDGGGDNQSSQRRNDRNDRNDNRSGMRGGSNRFRDSERWDDRESRGDSRENFRSRGDRDNFRNNSGGNRGGGDPEGGSWRNFDNHGNKISSPSFKRRNRPAVTRDSEGYVSQAKAKPMKSLAREKQNSQKKKLAEQEGRKQKSSNAFAAFYDDDSD